MNRSKAGQRQHVTPDEAHALVNAAEKAGRNGARDAALILIAYQQGFRVSEVCQLQWADVDLKAGSIMCRRLKGSVSNAHPLSAAEIKALRRLQKTATGPFVFCSERGDVISHDMAHRVVKRAGEACGLPWVHMHCLRHGAGFRLANGGIDGRLVQHWLGHASANHTARYTALTDKTVRQALMEF